MINSNYLADGVFETRKEDPACLCDVESRPRRESAVGHTQVNRERLPLPAPHLEVLRVDSEEKNRQLQNNQ